MLEEKEKPRKTYQGRKNPPMRKESEGNLFLSKKPRGTVWKEKNERQSTKQLNTPLKTSREKERFGTTKGPRIS